MATFSPLELVQLAQGVGLTLPAAQQAAAYALVESGGNEGAIHHNRNGSTDYGLWQINDKAHPDFKPADMLHAGRNAMAMATISKGGTDWSAWKADQGTARLAAAEKAVAAALRPTVGATGTVGAGGSSTGTVAGNSPGLGAGFTDGVKAAMADAGSWAAAPFELGAKAARTVGSLVVNGADFSGILDTVQGIVLAAVFVAGGIGVALYGVSKLGGANAATVGDAVQLATAVAAA